MIADAITDTAKPVVRDLINQPTGRLWPLQQPCLDIG